jgi:hypothetical protein
VSQSADKPNSVRLRSVALHGAPQLRRDDHSSRSVIAHQLRRPTRWPRTGRPLSPLYLVLLRAGFCLPPTLPPARCALTAPFHHYHPCGFGCVFSVPLSVKLPCPGVTRRTALRSSDFPPAFALRASAGKPAVVRELRAARRRNPGAKTGDRLADYDRSIIAYRFATASGFCGPYRCLSA